MFNGKYFKRRMRRQLASAMQCEQRKLVHKQSCTCVVPTPKPTFFPTPEPSYVLPAETAATGKKKATGASKGTDVLVTVKIQGGGGGGGGAGANGGGASATPTVASFTASVREQFCSALASALPVCLGLLPPCR